MDDSAIDWVKKIRALPFLMTLADEKVRTEGGDRYEWMAKLRSEQEAAGASYVWTVAYRSPPSPCATREHEIASLGHEVIRPGGGGLGRLLISERELHDLELHARKLTEAERKKLERIFSS